MNKRYNSNLKRYIEIREGEEFCPKCDGKGRVPKSQGIGRMLGSTLECNECLGEGKIDWVEKAVGKKRINRTSIYAFERGGAKLRRLNVKPPPK
jgi:DnaJ-class molecular chaperone